VEYATEAFLVRIYDVSMGLREFLKGKPAHEAEQPLPPVDVDQPGWAARSVHAAVAEQVTGSTAERAKATSRTADQMKLVIDEVLEPQDGAPPITDPVIRESLEAQREELLKLAESDNSQFVPTDDDPGA
jgi:hypothetical protein